MRRLNRRPRMRETSSEQGAIGVLFGILVLTGVVIGMMALTVDVGNMMYERRQLQNGADAASLALADECARDADNCLADHDELLNANAPSDSLAQYDLTRAYAPDGACGRGLSNPNLPNCATADSSYTPDIADLSLCPPLPTWLRDEPDIPYVETYTRTESNDPNDDTLLPSYFAQALVGGPDQSSISACARAAWGTPSQVSASVPITISSCEWEEQTSSGTNYLDGPKGADPGYGSHPDQTAMPTAVQEITILLHTTSPSPELDPCIWNHKDTAGGFGWVDPTSGSCEAEVTTGDWLNIDPGNNVPSSCEDKFAGLWKTVVSIPVFDCRLKSLSVPEGDVPDSANCNPATNDGVGGAHTYYHVVGWAKFYVSGYKLGGGPAVTRNSIVTGNAPCSGDERCLSGWYVQGSLDDVSGIEAPGGDNDFGAYAVLPAG